MRCANDSWRIDLNIFDALGMFEPDLKKRKERFKLMGEDSPNGKEYRARLNKAFRLTRLQFSSLGGEMNRFYQSSSVYIEDEPLEAQTPKYTRDKESYYTAARPGWKGTVHHPHGAGRQGCLVSCGVPGLETAVFGIVWGQDYLDTGKIWHNVRGMESDGAVLVRPDRIVCWRSKTRLEHEHAAMNLEWVIQHILKW